MPALDFRRRFWEVRVILSLRSCRNHRAANRRRVRRASVCCARPVEPGLEKVRAPWSRKLRRAQDHTGYRRSGSSLRS